MLVLISAFLTLIVFPGPQSRTSSADADLAACTVNGVRDLEARVSVEKADLPQLEKINKDFGVLYRLREVTIRYKDPDKFRMDNRLGVFIVNGSTRYIRVPQLGLRRRDEMGAELGRRHSLLDIGILTPARLEQMRWRYVRTEMLQGRSLPTFEIRFGDGDTSRYVLWMDTRRKYLVRREWLDSEGKVRATFDYLQPVEVLPGVWIPTRIEVRNAEGILAGATAYRDLKVNLDPPDSLFEPDQK